MHLVGRLRREPAFTIWRRRTASLTLVTALTTLGLAVLFAVPAGAVGTTLYVASTGTDTGNCQSMASPCATIGYALSQGSANDTIDVGPGTFTEETLVMSYPVTINGAGASNTIVDVSQHNPICATYIAVAISITTTNNPCVYPGPSAGSYTFNGMTIVKRPGFPGGSRAWKARSHGARRQEAIPQAVSPGAQGSGDPYGA
ncbi:MAG TPA: hypothetical protein VK277_03040 [Acidimicrobiales bacterium]|nr:hypothetical protein [Acidimicrobiales bacterium]